MTFFTVPPAAIRENRPVLGLEAVIFSVIVCPAPSNVPEKSLA